MKYLLRVAVVATIINYCFIALAIAATLLAGLFLWRITQQNLTGEEIVFLSKQRQTKAGQQHLEKLEIFFNQRKTPPTLAESITNPFSLTKINTETRPATPRNTGGSTTSPVITP